MDFHCALRYRRKRWMRSTAAAISRMSADERMTTLRGMVRTLLANRFHLAVHLDETRTLPVLALTAAKGGPKLVSSSVAPTPKGEWTGLHNPGASQMEGRDVTVNVLASALSKESEVDGQLRRRPDEVERKI